MSDQEDEPEAVSLNNISDENVDNSIENDLESNDDTDEAAIAGTNMDDINMDEQENLENEEGENAVVEETIAYKEPSYWETIPACLSDQLRHNFNAQLWTRTAKLKSMESNSYSSVKRLFEPVSSISLSANLGTVVKPYVPNNDINKRIVVIVGDACMIKADCAIVPINPQLVFQTAKNFLNLDPKTNANTLSKKDEPNGYLNKPETSYSSSNVLYNSSTRSGKESILGQSSSTKSGSLANPIFLPTNRPGYKDPSSFSFVSSHSQTRSNFSHEDNRFSASIDTYSSPFKNGSSDYMYASLNITPVLSSGLSVVKSTDFATIAQANVADEINKFTFKLNEAQQSVTSTNTDDQNNSNKNTKNDGENEENPNGNNNVNEAGSTAADIAAAEEKSKKSLLGDFANIDPNIFITQEVNKISNTTPPAAALAVLQYGGTEMLRDLYNKIYDKEMFVSDCIQTRPYGITKAIEEKEKYKIQKILNSMSQESQKIFIQTTTPLETNTNLENNIGPNTGSILFAKPHTIIHSFPPAIESPDLLRDSYRKALMSSMTTNSSTIALSLLSGTAYPQAGIPYYPLIPAVHCMLRQLREFMEKTEVRSVVTTVVICCSCEREMDVVQDLMYSVYFQRDIANETDADDDEDKNEGSDLINEKKEKKKGKKGKKKGKKGTKKKGKKGKKGGKKKKK